jgi:dTDP-4-amino-4,6-dideoxygalactose transaminase
MQACYPEFANSRLPLAEQLANEVLSLPMSPVMTREQVVKVVESVNEFVA